MARQNIGVGASANDGTGDTLRSAGTKINDTFVEIYRMLGGGDSDNLSSQISLEDSAIVFEGASIDAFETRLTVVDATADRQIQLPDAAGIVTLNDATQTLSNKTIQAPQINNPKIGAAINDSNGSELISFTANSTAINQINIANAATTNAPVVSVIGTDTNINMTVNSKGTGSVEIRKAAYTSSEITANGAASANATYIICNKASALAISLADGTTTGEYKIFTNKGAGLATVTPANFSAGSSFAIAQNEAAQCVWDGANWFLIGNQSVCTVV